MRRQLTAELVAEMAALEAKTKAANRQLEQLVTAAGSTVMDLNGISPTSAARLIGDVGDIARFRTRGHFASWNGTAPIDASSGDRVHHRLSRCGNRRLNRVLHIMAIVQLRNSSPGRTYYDRKRGEGKSSMEALRCLKRRLSDVVYRLMLSDAHATAVSHDVEEPDLEAVTDLLEPSPRQAVKTGPGGQVRASTGSSAAGSDPHTGPSEKSLPGPATTRITTHTPRRKRQALT